MTENRWDINCIGRQQELNDLIIAWNKAKTNHPQLLLILGDSGYGKTRLVMEFYNWLSTHEDEAEPNGYWPDSLGRDGDSLNVNPSFENHNAQGEIPWLWWGLRWHDFKHNKTPSSLNNFFPDLAPHVDPIVRRRHRKELIKKTGRLLLGWTTFGASEAIQTAWSILKDASEVIDYTKEARELHQSAGRYHHTISENERAKPVEDCLDFLAAILDPDDRESKTFPVVLILDDAQWMDRISLRFLKKLFKRAMRSNWPLLVITTHWEYLWHENIQAVKGLSPRQPDTIESNFAELVCTFETDGVLTNWVPYRISKLSDEYIMALTRSALPGLTSTQIDRIAQKVDGNPTYLGDVIAYLKHSLRHFIDKDPTKYLSKFGESVFERTINTEHIDLVRNRFDSLEEDLRLLLAQASYQGIRFIDEITSEVAIKLGEFQNMEKPRLLFRAASYPETITDLVGENVYEFRQRSFFDIARETLDREDVNSYGLAMMSVVIEWYRQDRFKTFSPLDCLHLYRWIADHTDIIGANPPPLWPLYWTLAANNFDNGAVWLQLAINDNESHFGPEHPNVAPSLSLLAMLYLAQSQYKKAEQLFKRALAITEKALGPDNPNVGMIISNLAENYRAQGQYKKAEQLFKRALAILKKGLGPEDLSVATNLSGLALLYRAQGQYKKAESRYRRALIITEKALGPDNPIMGTIINNLAENYRAQGQYKKAEQLHQRALAMREKALGLEHPDVAQSLNNLAVLYCNQGKYGEAERLHQRALVIREKALGPEHPDVAQSFHNLAFIYQWRHQYPEAESRYLRALDIREKALGPEHPDVATTLHNLAWLYNIQSRYIEAELLDQRALVIRENALGPEHNDVAACLNNLAENNFAQGQYPKAESLFKRALSITKKAQGPKHPNVAMILENYAALLRKLNRAAEAEKMETMAKAIRITH